MVTGLATFWRLVAIGLAHNMRQCSSALTEVAASLREIGCLGL